MIKTSTLVYSLHNLASKAQNELQDVKDLDGRNKYSEVYKLLDESELYDVNEEVVNRILKQI